MRYSFTVTRPLRRTLVTHLIHATALLLISGCLDTTTKDVSPLPQFVVPPEFELDPNLNTPLAGVLHVSTNIPCKVRLEISTDEKQWSRDFSKYQTSQAVNVLGLRPDTTHKISLTIIDRFDRQATLTHPVIVTTDPLPDGFPGLLVHKSQPSLMEPGYTLFDVIPGGDNAEFGALIVIVDETGEVVWYQVGSRFTNAKQTPDGNLMFLQGSDFVEMDMLGNSVREWKAMGKSNRKIPETPVKTPSFHHEVFPMANGNFLTLSIEARQFENYPSDAWKPHSPKESIMVAGDLAIEFAPDGSIVNQWSLLDLLDPYRVGYDSLGKYWDSFFGTKTRDWSHANSIIHNPVDDSIIVSIRHQDALVKFSRKTGKLIWILGPHDNWNTERFGKYLLHPVNNRQFFFPYHQHSPMILQNGNILLYDNGNYRASPFQKIVAYKNNFSRAVEYKVDEKNMTVELIWEYGQFNDNRVYSGALGDANYLPKTGNVLITNGNVYEKNFENRLRAQIVEVTHTKPVKEVFRMSVYDQTGIDGNGWRVYRSERIPDLYRN